MNTGRKKFLGLHHKRQPIEGKKYTPNTMTLERTDAKGHRYHMSDIYDKTDPKSVQELRAIYSDQQIATLLNRITTNSNSGSTPKVSDEEIAEAIQPREVKNSNAAREDYIDFLQTKNDSRKKAKEIGKKIKELTDKIEKLKQGGGE